ncbi:hypothetical protein BGX28_000579, partial [Mortierella sp. GBA30]
MLPLINLDQADIDNIVEHVPGGVANIQDIYALSPLQDGILFHHLMAKKGDPYMLYASMSFDSKTSLDSYLAIVQQIVDRHDVLRTAFLWQNLSTPAQVVWRNAPLSITELHLDPADGPVAKQLKQMFDPRTHRLDLTQAPLLRFVVAQESDDRWIIIQLLHHLIEDHSTGDTMESEIRTFYEGQGDSLPPAQPYRNLIAQARLGMSQEEHERFFKEMLADIDTPSLPFGITDVHGDGIQITEARRILPQDLNNRLRSQAMRLGISVASLCHVAWGQVIARTSGQQRVVFGTVLFGRMQAASSSGQAMGLFINTLPIRVDLDSSSVEDSARVIHARLAALLEHEHASLALAQRCSSVATGVPLFSSLLNYRHNLPDPKDDGHVHRMEILESEERTNYPFDISVEDYGTSLGLTAQVAQPLDPARVCGYMQEALTSLADLLENAPNTPVAQLEVLPMDERQMLLSEWNSTAEADRDQHCLHHLFEQQVERTPDAVAVVHLDQSLTYAELNNRANSLAHHLIAHGVKPETLVAICVERSLAMIVGILAILKAGGAYIPLDPLHASERLQDVLDDTAPICVIADKAGKKVLRQASVSESLVLDPNAPITDLTFNPMVTELTPQHLAYILYTSGSTGKPKGVMVEHRGVVNLVQHHSEVYGVPEHARSLQLASISFDASVAEIFLAITFGHILYIVPDKLRMDRDKLWKYIDQHSITFVTCTPAFLQDVNDLPPTSKALTLVLGGEALSNSLLHSLIRQGNTIFNDYGPTEASISSATWKCPVDYQGDVVPIGRPVKNTRLYVLDAHQQLAPAGVIGELYIGGAGVARGYLNKPEQTAERFLLDPFSKDEGARMYRTGDLARYLSDGNLVYLGRNDDQVKIRGFRVELGEVEARLAEHDLVAEAVVVAMGEGSNRRLVAYVITRNGESSSIEHLPLALRSHLSKRLPDYMVPTAFVRMDAFPLTPNDKLDRRALPTPGYGAFALQEYAAPQGDIENALAAIWSKLLHVERVGRHDSFFALGGHSLLAVRLVNRVSNLGAHIPLSSLFDSPTLMAFATVVSESIA